MSSNGLKIEGSNDPKIPKLRLHESDSSSPFSSQPQEYHLRSMTVVEILTETLRILRYNCAGFIGIATLLICPVSAIALSNILTDHSIINRLTIKLLLIATTSGLPLNSVLKQSCQKFSETAVSTVMCFPLYITILLLSKTAVVYSVDCSYSKKRFDASKFYTIVKKLWRRVVSTYIWACTVAIGVLTLFLVLLLFICNMFLILNFPPEMIFYPGVITGLVFSVVFANAVIICNVAIVISVLEDASGPQALLRSSMLIRGQTQVGLLMYLGSTIGMAFVQGLFEYRVKVLRYGDVSSRIWEGPLLVVLYSLVVLVDFIMTAVFYFSCRLLSLECDDGEEGESILEIMTASPHSPAVE